MYNILMYSIWFAAKLKRKKKKYYISNWLQQIQMAIVSLQFLGNGIKAGK